MSANHLWIVRPVKRQQLKVIRANAIHLQTQTIVQLANTVTMKGVSYNVKSLHRMNSLSVRRVTMKKQENSANAIHLQRQTNVMLRTIVTMARARVMQNIVHAIMEPESPPPPLLAIV